MNWFDKYKNDFEYKSYVLSKKTGITRSILEFLEDSKDGSNVKFGTLILLAEVGGKPLADLVK